MNACVGSPEHSLFIYCTFIYPLLTLYHNVSSSIIPQDISAPGSWFGSLGHPSSGSVRFLRAGPRRITQVRLMILLCLSIAVVARNKPQCQNVSILSLEQAFHKGTAWHQVIFFLKFPDQSDLMSFDKYNIWYMMMMIWEYIHYIHTYRDKVTGIHRHAWQRLGD